MDNRRHAPKFDKKVCTIPSVKREDNALSRWTTLEREVDIPKDATDGVVFVSCFPHRHVQDLHQRRMSNDRHPAQRWVGVAYHQGSTRRAVTTLGALRCRLPLRAAPSMQSRFQRSVHHASVHSIEYHVRQRNPCAEPVTTDEPPICATTPVPNLSLGICRAYGLTNRWQPSTLTNRWQPSTLNTIRRKSGVNFLTPGPTAFLEGAPPSTPSSVQT